MLDEPSRQDTFDADRSAPASTAAVDSSMPAAVHATAEPPASASAISPEEEWTAQLRLLNKRFTEQERLGAERERVIDRLHEENQRLKAGELLKQMTPIYRDLMRLYDDLVKTGDEYAERESVRGQTVAGDWNFFATLVTDLLYRYGVEQVEVEPGTPFEAKNHRAAAIKITAQQELDKTIVRVVAAGFVSDGRVLRPAAVEVLRYQAPPTDLVGGTAGSTDAEAL